MRQDEAPYVQVLTCGSADVFYEMYYFKHGKMMFLQNLDLLSNFLTEFVFDPCLCGSACALSMKFCFIKRGPGCLIE